MGRPTQIRAQRRGLIQIPQNYAAVESGREYACRMAVGECATAVTEGRVRRERPYLALRRRREELDDVAGGGEEEAARRACS